MGGEEGESLPAGEETGAAAPWLEASDLAGIRQYDATRHHKPNRMHRGQEKKTVNSPRQLTTVDGRWKQLRTADGDGGARVCSSCEV